MTDDDARPDRAQTDASLDAERGKTDRELAARRAAIAADADRVVQRARDHADAVLLRGRQKVDDAASRIVAAPVRRERASEDAAVEAERVQRDAMIGRERERNDKAMDELLDAERATTDGHLEKEREQSDSAVTARDDFLSMVSHDLRGLVSGVALNAAVLAATADDQAGPDVRARAQSIQRSASRMGRLIGDLLDVAAVEAGKLAIVPELGDAAALVRETIDAFQLVASTNAITLESDGDGAPIPVPFDHGRALQVLANLVGNALEATAPGGHVRVGVAANQNEVAFDVTDTGSGIARECVASLFDRYRQGPSASPRGLGLGLYIAKSIIDAHGGRIWVEHTSNEGSTFRFTLPNR